MREVGITAEREQAAVRMAATVNAAAAKAPEPVMLARVLPALCSQDT